MSHSPNTQVSHLAQAREWGQSEAVLTGALRSVVDAAVTGAYAAVAKWLSGVPSSTPLPPLGEPLSSELSAFATAAPVVAAAPASAAAASQGKH